MINLNDLVKENQLNTDMTELTEQQTNCIVGGVYRRPNVEQSTLDRLFIKYGGKIPKPILDLAMAKQLLPI